MAKKVEKKAKKTEKPASKKQGPGRISWLDDKTERPLIDEYARKLDSFIQAMADGKVDDKEIRSQERRLAKLMKEVEPLLDDDQHAKVTVLLCELAAYDMMQMLKVFQDIRPQTKFQG